jgi:hypothetical protein
MDQRAGKHAGKTSLALLCIDKKISFGGWNRRDGIV